MGWGQLLLAPRSQKADDKPTGMCSLWDAVPYLTNGCVLNTDSSAQGWPFPVGAGCFLKL